MDANGDDVLALHGGARALWVRRVLPVGPTSGVGATIDAEPLFPQLLWRVVDKHGVIALDFHPRAGLP